MDYNQDYFDFKIENEPPDEESRDMRRCPHCNKFINSNSLFCLYCGESIYPGKKNRWVVLVVFVVLIAFLLWIFIS